MKEKSFIVVWNRRESTKIDIDDILYIERRLRKIYLLTEVREIEYYEKMKYVEPVLADYFFKIGNGTFINITKIKSVQEDKVIFDCGLEMGIPRKIFFRLKQKHQAHFHFQQIIHASKKVEKQPDGSLKNNT